MQTPFEGKSVLVTGAGGSIGSRLCHIVTSQNAKRLVLFSLTEAGLYTIDRDLRQTYQKYRDTEFVPVLGNVCSQTQARAAVKDIDIVIHAAAHKHVPICEANPMEAIRNNIGGTYTLFEAAAANDVEQFCFISTDKAVLPKSVMGQTKRVCEKIVRDLKPSYSHMNAFTVRFGNVLNSAGSVIPLWREQIQRGEELTLTDPGCERYFMSIPEAVGLICDTIAMNPEDGTFLLDMGKPRRLIDMAEALMDEMKKRVAIKMIGLRPGEKLTEELYSGGDLVQTRAPRIYKLNEPVEDETRLNLMKLRWLQEVAADRPDEALEYLKKLSA